MEALQRSTISFRRQGSSGIVFDDRLIAELSKQGNEQKDESQRDEQPKPMSEGSEQGKPIAGAGDERDKLRPIKTGVPTTGGIERSRSNGGGAPRHHRTTGRVSPAVEPPSPRISTCGCCSAFGKKPPGKKNNPRKRPPKRRSR
uniref:MAPK kinase substrate protein n=1 Tax=Noccaea caerulescens TaxID=107243 RepID=A0A1J3I3J4_NOCCA